MLLRGTLYGLGIAIRFVGFVRRSMMAQFPPLAGGNVAVDLRSISQSAARFFGGMSIAFGVVAAVIFSGVYALLAHVHQLPRRSPLKLVPAGLPNSTLRAAR